MLELGEMKRGLRVRLTDEFKQKFAITTPDHVREFGNCVGTLEGPAFSLPQYEWDVRWAPSGLRYAYGRRWLEKVEACGEPYPEQLGFNCSLDKGHTGDHSVALYGGPVTWPQK